MTKAEKAKYLQLMSNMEVYQKEEDKAFKILQDTNRKIGTGKPWCSARKNWEDLLSCGKDYTNVYEDYIRYGAKYDAYLRIGQAFANFGLWK